MNPFSALYGAAIGVRNALYEHGTFRPRHLQLPVISIGNIAVGGTGKTPFTILLGSLLKQRGITFNVLSRGYRRLTTGTLIVDPSGRSEEFGDEPLLIARTLDVPVVVGESRYDAGRLAESHFTSQLHLLDDGFQHRQLARDFDIVLLTDDDMRSGLLPAGRLREPLASLSRADAIVVDESFDFSALALSANQMLWRTRRGIKLTGSPARPIAFCGIARPNQFFHQLRALGVQLAGEVAFRDHHRYTAADLRRLRELAHAVNADGFITTAKDEVNLAGMKSELGHLSVADVELELLNAGDIVQAVLGRISAPLPKSPTTGSSA